mgnify:CR=1 FL=1
MAHVRLTEEHVRLKEERVRLTEERVRLTEERVRLTEERVRLTEERVRITEERVRITEECVRQAEECVRQGMARGRGMAGDLARLMVHGAWLGRREAAFCGGFGIFLNFRWTTIRWAGTESIS